MGRVTVMPEKYIDESDVVNVLYYICNMEKCRSAIYGVNKILGPMPILNPDSVASQFITIQNSSSLNFRRRIFHIGYDLDNALDTVCSQAIWCIGTVFCRYLRPYQSIFAVHENTKNLHLHLVVNNVPVDGRELLSRWLNKLTLERLADDVLEEIWHLVEWNLLAQTNPWEIVGRVI